MRYLLLILLALIIAGTLDRDDAIDEHSYYCSMVADGVWPDYRGTCK